MLKAIIHRRKCQVGFKKDRRDTITQNLTCATIYIPRFLVGPVKLRPDLSRWDQPELVVRN